MDHQAALMADCDAAVDHGHPRAGVLPAVDILANLRQAAPTVRGLARVLASTCRLSRSAGRLMPAEFFQHRLWDRDLMPGDPASFVGLARQGQFHRACCDPGWRATADDKLVTDNLLRGAGVESLAETMAVVHPVRTLSGLRLLRTTDDVARFLQSPRAIPFVAKPIDGMFSVGVVHGVGHNATGDRIVTVDGGSEAVRSIAERILAHGAGYVIQRALQPDRMLGAVTGNRLCSVRALLLVAGFPECRDRLQPTGKM